MLEQICQPISINRCSLQFLQFPNWSFCLPRLLSLMGRIGNSPPSLFSLGLFAQGKHRSDRSPKTWADAGHGDFVQVRLIEWDCRAARRRTIHFCP